MTAADLTHYQEIYETQQAFTDLARVNRDNAVRMFLAECHTHQEAADATGLTRGRIGQIANPKDGTDE